MKNLSVTRKFSILSGISLLAMTFLAAFSFGYVMNAVYAEGNTVETLLNIGSNPSLYLAGNLGWVLIFIADLLVTIGFYMFLRNLSSQWAILASALRLIYTLILGGGILFLFGKDIPGFMNLWSIGLIVFGFHLTATGLITLLSQKGLNHGSHSIPFSVPKLISLLLIIAGLSYTLIHSFTVFFPDFTVITAVPFPFAVIFPLEVTTATDFLLDA